MSPVWRSWLLLSCLVAIGCAPAGPTAVSIDSVSLSPSSVSYGGGAVTITAQVSGTPTQMIGSATYPSGTVESFTLAESSTQGSYSAQVQAQPNVTTEDVSVTIAVVALDADGATLATADALLTIQAAPSLPPEPPGI